MEWEERPLAHNLRVVFVGFSLTYSIYFILRFLGMKQYNDSFFAIYLFVGVSAIIFLYVVEKITGRYCDDVESIRKQNEGMMT